MRRTLAFIGSGRVAGNLSRSLRARGCVIAAMGSPRSAPGLQRLIRGAGIVMICVPDDALGQVADRLASLPPPGVRGKVVLHTSGVAGPAPLRVLRKRGASVGCLHPQLAFPPAGGSPPDMRGACFAVDGDPGALRTARALVKVLGGQSLAITESERPAYHLMATLLATGTAVLLDVCVEMASKRLRLPGSRALGALAPLARSVIQNVSAAGPRRALTGPVARGDVRTVARHLQTLRRPGSMITKDKRGAKAMRELYRLVSLRAVQMARSEGRIDAATAARLRRELSKDHAH